MDQVKRALIAIKKHHFWVLCGVLIVVGLTIWTSASADLKSRFEKRKTTLEGIRDQVLGVSKGGSHPNQGVIDAIVQQHEKLKENVFGAWKTLYDDQRDKNEWPKELGEPFLIMINSLGPDDEIPIEDRELYQNFVVDHFPALFETIDIRLPAQRDEKGEIFKDQNGRVMKVDPFETADVGREGRATGARDTQLAGKVFWNPEDLKRVRVGFTWTTTPETFQVRLAQEDLWVYEVLLRVIKFTNEGATSHFNAALKRIEALQIGQVAGMAFQKSASRIFRSGGAGAMGVGPGPGEGGPSGQMMEGGYGEGAYSQPGYGEAGMPPGGVPEGGMPGSATPAGDGAAAGGTSSAQQLLIQLMEGRYVNKKGEPLSATAAMTGPPFAEFKMMPIRMLLIMDQRRIADLLVHCANSSMPIEVFRVSINPGQGQQIDLQKMIASARPSDRPGIGGGPGYGPGGMPGGGYGPGGEGMGFGGGEMGQRSPGGPGGRRDDSQAMGAYDVAVEIEGIIYIFIPPDRAKLGTGSAGEEPTTTPPPPTTPGVEQPTPPVQPPTPPVQPPTPPVQPPTPLVEEPTGIPVTPAEMPPAPPATPAAVPATPGPAATPPNPGPPAEAGTETAEQRP